MPWRGTSCSSLASSSDFSKPGICIRRVPKYLNSGRSISLGSFVLLSTSSVFHISSVHSVKAHGKELLVGGILALWLGALRILICHTSFDWFLPCLGKFLLLRRSPLLLWTKAALNLLYLIKH